MDSINKNCIMKKIALIMMAAAMMFASCTKFLDVPPSGVLSNDNVTGPDAVEGLVTAAYAGLINDGWNTPFNLWVTQIIRTDDAYKGGSDTNDQGFMHWLEVSENWNTLINNGTLNNLWVNLYRGVSRCNSALAELNALDASTAPLKETRIAEVKFLRAQYYIRLKINWNRIPWVDETMDQEAILSASNTALSSDELWAKIFQDCVDAYKVLPEKQTELGRPTKYAAAAAAAKVALYRASQLDDQNKLTGISKERMEEVLQYTQVVLGGPYALNEDFGLNFYPAGDNSKESIWAIQYSHNDNTMKGRANIGNGLVWTSKLSGGCDFLKPSQNLVNAFKTTDGIPQFSDFNEESYDFENPTAYTVDPRLYHTVSMPGVAFKLKYDTTQPNNNMYAKDWTRNESQYGFYATAKQVVPVNDPTICAIPPFQSCSMNKDDYRLDDVILMRAEALVETGKWQEAKDLVNQIRRRAATSTTYFKENTGVTKNYEVRPYTDAEWSSEAFARQAVRWERRLELAMEGWRFFDLVRWGNAADVLNPYFAKEATRIAAYTDQGKLIAKYDAGDEFLPIPNTQLVLSKGVYEQSWPFK